MSGGLTLVSRMAAVPALGIPSVARRPGQDRESLERLASEVRSARPHLVDHWEATAVVEALGYNDGRVQREFGLANTLEVGEYIWEGRAPVGVPLPPWIPETESTGRIVARSAISTLVYAVPWLSVFVGQTLSPTAMMLPSQVAPAVALALMFSLVVSGGFVQAIVRRGEFYVGNLQVGLAREVIRVLTRAGMLITVVVALAGVGLGWYFELAGWPALILGADVFVTLSALWMVCGTFAIRRQQWRVSVTFGFGFVAFLAARQLGADVLTAQLVAATVLLIAALAQSRGLFADGQARPASVNLPQLSVVVYRTAPYFWYGIAYFSFLFADRLVAGTAGSGVDAAFGIPVPYVAGMELALLTFLLAASGLEVAGALFSRALTNEARQPFLGDSRPLVTAMQRHHTRALLLAVGTFIVAAVLVAAGARALLSDTLSLVSWRLLLVGDLAYLCLALGLVNALALFQTGRPWAAVRGLSIALGINLAAGFILGHFYGSYFASAGLLCGALAFVILSTADVRQAVARPDFSYAVR
jgi:hypothetical protein